MGYDFTEADYTPHFSGHDSFQLRYGWLKKAHDEVVSAQAAGRDTLKVFTDDEAIARFGVGKNMVVAIRYWATSCGVIKNVDGKVEIGEVGHRLFGPDGYDPYLENPSSIWLIHWALASNLDRTTYYWMFNFFSDGGFDKKLLDKKLLNFADKCGWKKPNKATVEKDTAVLLNTYAMGAPQKKGSQEDSLTSPLAELGLIRRGSEDGRMHLGWGAKPNLGDGVFLYALLDFWAKTSTANTLNFQTILLAPGSPGRIFLMDENDLAVRLMKLDAYTDGAFGWSETAGMRQVVRSKEIGSPAAWDYVASDFGSKQQKAA